MINWYTDWRYMRGINQKLLEQIELVYECMARDGYNSESTSHALNGLFKIAREENTERMRSAWERGVQAEAERLNQHFHAR